MVQSVTMQSTPLPANYGGKTKNNRPFAMPPIKPTITQAPDQVRFGKIPYITGPIPPQSLIILVPGMYSPAYSMRPLADFLKPRGHTVHTLASPFNIRGGSALESTDWLTHNIDRIRLDEASKRYTALLDQMEANIPRAERVDFLCRKLGLTDTPLGKATAKAALGLMFKRDTGYETETDFTRIILQLRQRRQESGGVLPPETARKQLYSLSAIARKQLHRELLPSFMNTSGQSTDHDAALEKTIDHVMDQIAPRVILVGHSMGGFVSMLTLFEQMNDTAMVVGLSAPGENGTEAIPNCLGIFRSLPQHLQEKGRNLVEKFAPGLAHMMNGSPETERLKANHQPFNTTLLAVGLPENYDGLVSEKNFLLNDKLPGRINVIVSPQKATISGMVSDHLNTLNRWLRLNPLYAWSEDYLHQSSELIKGIAYHCGVLQSPPKYWEQDGDILRGIFESPKNPQGKYDYQLGQPDYAESITQIRRAINPHSYEAERVHFLNILEDHLNDARKEKSPEDYKKLLASYAPLQKDLQAIQQERQPLENGVAQKAENILTLFSEAE